MIHIEYLDHIWANNDAFVLIKPGASKDAEDVPIRPGGRAVTISTLCSSSELFKNFAFLPGEYGEEDLSCFFERNKNINALKVTGSWVQDYLHLIADSLLYLSINSSKVVKLPDVLFQKLNRLSGEKIRFRASNFPSLEHLSLVGDKQSLCELRHITTLKTLNIINCKLAEIGCYISKNNLVFLGLRGGVFTNFDELNDCSSLKGIWVQDIKGYLDFSKLRVAGLKELTVGYCDHLVCFEEFIRSSNLSSIHIFGCKGLEKATIKPLLDTCIKSVVYS